MNARAPRIVALCGGIGGAKLALGLYHALPAGALAVIGNTGDDFEHLGLHVSPDLDTLLYTLAGINDPERGWGQRDETWAFMASLERLGGDTWFSLGDRDLALHVERTRRLAAGRTLSAVTASFATALDISAQLLPMSDDPVRTVVETDAGALAFQHYFVREACAPRISGVRFDGASDARLTDSVRAAFASDALEAIVVCPSNPYLSVDPLLAVPGMRAALQAARAPVVAVSPIVGGAAVKGPTDKIMRELGVEVSQSSIARHYAGLLDGLVVDADDAAAIDVAVRATSTLMRSLDDRVRLAEEVLDFAACLRGEPAVSR